MSRSTVSELSFVSWIRRHSAGGKGVRIGIGDDAAVLEIRSPIVVTTDMLLDGVHFRSDRDPPQWIGWKALACNLSDLAAMAARPRHAVVAVGFPEGYETRSAHALFRGLLRAAGRFECTIVGGDTNASHSGVVVSVTLIGELVDGPVTRSGAQVGDAICVTGRLGGSILGKHLRFVPRVEEAIDLARRYRLHSLIDVTDGLLLDAWRIAKESGVGMVIDSRRVPISAAARKLSMKSSRSALDHALRDGEDFELLFTLPRSEARRLLRDPRHRELISVIGDVLPRGFFLADGDGRIRPVAPGGYEHFRDDVPDRD